MPVHRKKTRKSSKSSRKQSRRTASWKATHERSLALLSDLRRREAPYTKLLRKHGLDSRTARAHLGRDLVGGGRGKPVRATKSDRRVRLLMFPTSSGDVPRQIRGSQSATKLSEFFQDRDRLLRGKMSEQEFEAKWRSVHVAGEELFAYASAILTMADADELKLDNLYASTGGAR